MRDEKEKNELLGYFIVPSRSIAELRENNRYLKEVYKKAKLKSLRRSKKLGAGLPPHPPIRRGEF